MSHSDSENVPEAYDAPGELPDNTPYSWWEGPGYETVGLYWGENDIARTGRDHAVLFPFPDAFYYTGARGKGAAFSRTLVVPAFVSGDDPWKAARAPEGMSEAELARRLEIVWRRLIAPDHGPLGKLRRLLMPLLGHGEASLSPRVVHDPLHDGTQYPLEEWGAHRLKSGLHQIWRDACQGADAEVLLSRFDRMTDLYTIPALFIAFQRSLLANEIKERDDALAEASELAEQYIGAQLWRIIGPDEWEIERRVRPPVLDSSRTGKWYPLREFIAAALSATIGGRQEEQAAALWRLVSADGAARAHCDSEGIDLEYLQTGLSPQRWSDVRNEGRRYQQRRGD